MERNTIKMWKKVAKDLIGKCRGSIVEISKHDEYEYDE